MRLQVVCACVCACVCVYECVLHDPYTSSSYTGQSLTQSVLLSHCLNLHPRQECRKKHAQHRSRGNKPCLCYIGSLPPQSLMECILRMCSPSGWLCAFLWDRFTSMHSSHITQHLVSKWGGGSYCMCVFMYKHVLYIYHAGSPTAAVC